MLSQHIRVHAFDVRVVHCETLKLLGENGSTCAAPIGAREVRKIMSTPPEDYRIDPENDVFFVQMIFLFQGAQYSQAPAVNLSGCIYTW